MGTHSEADRIERIETVRWSEQPNILWVRVFTRDGLIGLGETYYLPESVEAVIHELVAPRVLGESPFAIEQHWHALFAVANFYGFAGAEMRAMSALDIALWDIAGKSLGVPVWALFGGKVRDTIPVYNTCVSAGKYSDGESFLDDPEQLATDLLASGISAMKIWPWDQFAPQLSGQSSVGPAGRSAHGPMGHFLSTNSLVGGLHLVERIRNAVGTDMEIMVEGHSRWNLPNAIRISRALEDLRPMWAEDLMQPNTTGALAKLANSSRTPQAVSERLFSRFRYEEVLAEGAADMVMLDVAWTGGISEARKIATLASAHNLSVSPHDCTGPITQFANLQLCASIENISILESVRGFYDGGWYTEPLTSPLVIERGIACIPTEVGIGTALSDEFMRRNGVSTRMSTI